MEENKSIEEPKKEEGIPQEKLLGLLTQRQKKALGLLPNTYQSEKAKARNEMLRERMRKINEDRKSQAKKAVKGVIVEKAKPKKRKDPEPESEESEETSSEDQVIQKRAHKMDRTIRHLSSVEERLKHLQASRNPFIGLFRQ